MPRVNYGCDYVYPVTQQEGASSKALAQKPVLKYTWEPVAPESPNNVLILDLKQTLRGLGSRKHSQSRPRCCKCDAAKCTNASVLVFLTFSMTDLIQTHIWISVCQCQHTETEKLSTTMLCPRCVWVQEPYIWIPYMQVRNHSAARDFESFCRERQQESGCMNGAAVLEKTHLCCISSTNMVINIVNDSIWNRRVLLMLGKMEECVNHSLKSREMLTTICLGKHNIWIWFRYDALCWAIIKTWVTIRVFPVQHPLVRHS